MSRDSGLAITPETGVATYRGRPVCLLAASEHYGAVINRQFDYRTYLDQMASEGLRFTRTFALFRELQTDRNPFSTCKPESTDFVAPYRRTGPGLAGDALPRYGLDLWNPEYFARLHGFLGAAQQHRVIVELTLLSNTYSETVWALSPLNPANNLSGLGPIPWHDYTSMRHTDLITHQERFVTKVLAEIEPYDNVLIEICNEPIGNFRIDGERVGPDQAEVDAWQHHLIDIVRRHDPRRPIAASPAWSYDPWSHPICSPAELGVDVINLHPLNGMAIDDATWDLGVFMTADSRLEEYASYCRRVHDVGAVNLDEDNNASRFMDERGWTIHRQRAWIALLSGCHYDYIDFAVRPGIERGPVDDQRGGRRWFAVLAHFWDENRIWRTSADDDIAKAPAGLVAVGCRDDAGARYIYVAAQLSSDLAEPFQPVAVEGSLHLDLPSGDYLLYFFAPETGRYFGWRTVRSESGVSVDLPGTANDVIVVVQAGAVGARA